MYQGTFHFNNRNTWLIPAYLPSPLSFTFPLFLNIFFIHLPLFFFQTYTLSAKMFSWFKSSNESKPTQEPTWNAATMAMEQPPNAEAMSSNNVVAQQPVCSPIIIC